MREFVYFVNAARSSCVDLLVHAAPQSDAELDELKGVLAERELGTIRWVLFGGESFPPGQLADLMERTFRNL